MLVVFDAGMLSVLIHPNATIPDDPTTGKPLSNAKERIAHLVSQLGERRATIAIPTPALAEFLFVVDDKGANYLRTLHTYSVFDVVEFDERAAIECAESQRKAFAALDKKSGAQGTYQKSKVDRQIIAVAQALSADVIYTTDDDIIRMAKSIGGMRAVGVWELELPPSEPAKRGDGPVGKASAFRSIDLFSGDDEPADPDPSSS